MKSIIPLVALSVILPARLLAAPEGAEAQLRWVADGILRQTTRVLVDRRNGQPILDSAGLEPRPEISIGSKFNAWFYQTWLLADGMRRTAAVLKDPAYQGYGEQNLAFIFQHMDYFQRQHDAKMTAAPVGDGKLSPIGFYFHLQALWHTGLAPLVLEQSMASGDPKYDPYLGRVRQFLTKAPRFEDGAFYRPGKGMMTDDPFMTVPFLLREWKRTGGEEFLTSAIAQVMGTHRRLLDPEHQLLRHLWEVKAGKPAGVFWGRGNGWMVLAHAELLAALPPDHPRRAEVLAAWQQHMQGLRRCADPAGGWHQVLDHPESWLETSCTGMITYGMARGVNEGWLDASFAPVARAGWTALQHKVTPEGDLTDVCGSTDTGDLNFYLNRPRLQGDLHGFGSYLLAGAEIVRMQAAAGAGPR
jgi:unsaturated rhamnogalacturonyl hydrolase